ncbi:MAG: FHA domain-containing protein [Anaerolineae bacterium]
MADLLLVLRFLLAFVLYAFLALTLYILWRDLKEGADAEVSGPPPAALFEEREDESPRRIPLRSVTALGRADDNTLILDDPFASAHHAIVLWREEQWWIEDLESHNGTYLNDERVLEPERLSSGDRIRIGETVLRFELTT